MCRWQQKQEESKKAEGKEDLEKQEGGFCVFQCTENFPGALCFLLWNYKISYEFRSHILKDFSIV